MRIVLVRPAFAGNIGATARAMRNFGLTDLVLVAPEADLNDREARKQSTQGEEILDRARIAGDLGAAIGDCSAAAATSARVKGLLRGHSSGTPAQVLPTLIQSLQAGPVALVFGPERTGLTNEEVALCQHVVHIPTVEDYQALNLSHAVAICLYALRCAIPGQTVTPPRDETVATIEERSRMVELLRASLDEIGFFRGGNEPTLMLALRRLIDRAEPTAMEVGILTGLARQIHWYVNERP